MIVDLISYTVLVPRAIKAMGYEFHEEGTVNPGDELMEVAGRECYQSWGRPNPDTATNEGYLANILDHGHMSIMEHVNLGFSIREVSRALTHELVRHRHLSFSQMSQRYVNESGHGFVVPPDIEEQEPDEVVALTDIHEDLIALYERIVHRLRDRGLSRKRARQAARYMLPNGHETRLVVTGNVRSWREFVIKRGAVYDGTLEPAADLEMYALSQKILEHLKAMVPNAVQDL